MIKDLLNTSLKEKPVSNLLIDVAENLPIITCFQDRDPLAIQMALRDEWN